MFFSACYCCLMAFALRLVCESRCYLIYLFEGMDPHWVRQADIGLPRPDVVVFFEVSPEVAKQRGGFGEERLESEQLQKKVHSAMELLRKSYWRVRLILILFLTSLVRLNVADCERRWRPGYSGGRGRGHLLEYPEGWTTGNNWLHLNYFRYPVVCIRTYDNYF